MEEIFDFEGIKVKKDKRGYYKCPYYCHDSRYPAKKWKTERGFKNHMKNCPERPSYKAQKAKEDAERKSRLEAELKKVEEELRNNFPYQIGDTVHYVREIITKPTHVERHGRKVRVRYEPEKIFRAYTRDVLSIDFSPSPSPKYSKLLINNEALLSDVYKTEKEAIDEAEKRAISWKETVDFARFCR